MKLYTVGFTKSSAEHFFARLQKSGVHTILDVRLKTDSQLSGFAKKKDLAYFLDRLAGSGYRHEVLLAPTADILDAYKKGRMSWENYAYAYTELIKSREVEKRITPESVDGACLLCSEDKPHMCHRRLAAEYLMKSWNREIQIVHL